MSKRTRSPGDALRVGRRALEEQSGVELLHDWQWSSGIEAWFLTLRLTISQPQGCALPHLPPQTDWCVVARDYPLDAPEFYPAKDGGITATFPHQAYNGEGRKDVPWRTGNLCLHRPLTALGRVIGNDEPRSEESRLLWRCRRALAWLGAADAGELALKGEAWELPDNRLVLARGTSFAFGENGNSFARWQSAPRSGLVELGLWRNEPLHFFAHSFLSASGQEVYKPTWGARFQRMVEKIGTTRGVWLRLDSVPIMPPFGTPFNWRELRESVEAQGYDLYELLSSGQPDLRNGQRHLALIGFPIPQIIGGEPSRIHWQAIQLPVLSNKANGFRADPDSASLHDRTHALRGGAVLDWVESSNWDVEQLGSRGRLGSALAHQNVLLIGAGALGSAVAELLVRAGVHQITVADGDFFRAGNLVRHTLTLDDLDEPKAPALAARLNSSSPQANVRPLVGRFPTRVDEVNRQLREATLVLDCTGDDELLNAMDAFDWQGQRLFVSCSLGWGGQRLWLFTYNGETFPSQTFHEELAPWLQREREQFADEMAPEAAPREGIGCWHPVFPARLDDIWLMAALAIKQLDILAQNPPESSQLLVWEQNETGVQRVQLP